MTSQKRLIIVVLIYHYQEALHCYISPLEQMLVFVRGFGPVLSHILIYMMRSWWHKISVLKLFLLFFGMSLELYTVNLHFELYAHTNFFSVAYETFKTLLFSNSTLTN